MNQNDNLARFTLFGASQLLLNTPFANSTATPAQLYPMSRHFFSRKMMPPTT
jgi:hypothetical protein